MNNSFYVHTQKTLQFKSPRLKQKQNKQT